MITFLFGLVSMWIGGVGVYELQRSGGAGVDAFWQSLALSFSAPLMIVGLFQCMVRPAPRVYLATLLSTCMTCLNVYCAGGIGAIMKRRKEAVAARKKYEEELRHKAAEEKKKKAN